MSTGGAGAADGLGWVMAGRKVAVGAGATGLGSDAGLVLGAGDGSGAGVGIGEGSGAAVTVAHAVKKADIKTDAVKKPSFWRIVRQSELRSRANLDPAHQCGVQRSRFHLQHATHPRRQPDPKRKQHRCGQSCHRALRRRFSHH